MSSLAALVGEAGALSRIYLLRSRSLYVEVEMQTEKAPGPVKQTEKTAEEKTPSSSFENSESIALLILILASLVLVMATGLLLAMPKP